MAEHYTAWLVNDRSALIQPNCDVTVLQDAITGYNTADDGTELPIWSTDIVEPLKFYAVTRVPAASDNILQAHQDAERLLNAAGWRLTEPWTAAPNAYIATVTRD